MKAIGLFNPKTPANIGAVLRASWLYQASFVGIQGTRYAHTGTDVGARYHVPILRCNDLHDIIPFDTVPVAVEILNKATSLDGYVHPRNAFYIFGGEDITLGKNVIKWCRDVVQIPMSAGHGCLNLGAAVNILLYDRLVKNRKGAVR